MILPIKCVFFLRRFCPFLKRLRLLFSRARKKCTWLTFYLDLLEGPTAILSSINRWCKQACWRKLAECLLPGGVVQFPSRQNFNLSVCSFDSIVSSGCTNSSILFPGMFSGGPTMTTTAAAETTSTRATTSRRSTGTTAWPTEMNRPWEVGPIAQWLRHWSVFSQSSNVVPFSSRLDEALYLLA